MLLSRSGNQTDAAIPKVISPTVHGVIDYCHAAFFFTVGAVCSRSHNKAAARAAFATGGFILVQSLLTDYRFGAKPVIPFEAHGKMDAAFAASSWLMPRILGVTGTPAARIFEVNSAVEASVVGMTDWDTERAHAART